MDEKLLARSAFGLAEIPYDWSLLKAKRTFFEVKDRGHEDETLLSVTQAQGILSREESELRVWNPGEDVSLYKLVKPGDFVISLRSFQGGIEWSGVRGIISPAYVVLRRRRELIDGFFRYLLKSRPFISLLQIVSTGIRQGKIINYSEFSGLPLLVPSLTVQQAIAEFLDRKTAEIDHLIEQKQRLIELLDEKRTALITRAVTRGLDPDVEMKDSGVEWLGEIPAHWSVAPVRRLSSHIEQGWSPQCEQRIAHEDEWGVLKAGCVNQWQFDASEHKALPADLEPQRQYEISEGDVLMSRANTRELVGSIVRVGPVRGKLLLSDKLYRIRLKPGEMLPEFFVAYVASRAGRFQFERDASGASGSMQNISQDEVRSLLVPMPPTEEQMSIARFIDDSFWRAKEVKIAIRKAITLLREYRTALISAAVTGKIDVRDTEEVA